MDALKRSLGLNVTSPAQRRRRGSRNDPAILDGNGNGEDEADYKQKIMGLWHSMKYGRTLFALDSSHPSSLTGGPSPVWFLGVSYQGRMSSENRMTTNLDRTLIERTKVRFKILKPTT